MKQFSLFLLFIVMTLAVQAINVKVIADGKPVSGATVRCYSANMDSITSAATDSLGFTEISTENVFYLNVEHPMFSGRLVKLTDIKDNTIQLDTAINLKEIEISVSNKKSYLSFDSYKLSMAQMEPYATFLNALNLIPNVEVLPSGLLYYKGNSNIKLLLDGFETSVQELLTISKADILQVDIYDTPTGKYALTGVNAVINVRTKSMLTGGNIGINLSQAFIPLWGDNTAAMYYNYGPWRWTARFDNSNKHFTKSTINSSIEYTVDGTEYKKEKFGMPSHRNMDNNSLSVSLQRNQLGVYLWKFEAGGALYCNGENNTQDVIANTGKFSAFTHLFTSSDNFWVTGNYEKGFGEKSKNGTLMANIHYKYFHNHIYSSYKESLFPSGENPFEDHYDDYRTRYDAYYADVQYETPVKEWGQFFTALSGQYKYSRYVDAFNPFYLRNTDIGYVAQYFGMKGGIIYSVNAGVKYQRSSTTVVEKPYSKFNPQGEVSLRWNILDNLQIALGYDYSTTMPAISQLSQTNQWVDTRIIYHGNAALKPFSTHDINFESSFAHQYVNWALSLGYSNSPGQICNQYLWESDHILETIVNLKKYRSLYGSLSLTVKPLGNYNLVFYTRIRGRKNHGVGPDYSWNGYTFQWNSSLTYRINRWSFYTSYQYPGKISEGQQIRPRAQVWSVSASFRPTNNLTVGLKWLMPFGKHLEESEKSVRTSIVQTNTEYIQKEWANCVSVTLAWNFMFGRWHNKVDAQIKNSDTDNGILIK